MNIDFNFWLLVFTITSGIIAVIDKLKFKPKRLAPVMAKLKAMPNKQRKKFIQKDKQLKPPFLADYAHSLFSVFLIVFILKTSTIWPNTVEDREMKLMLAYFHLFVS